MDTCIKIHRAWQSRSDMKRAVSEFTHQFNLLMVFAKAEPKLDVPCEYMGSAFADFGRSRDSMNS